MYLPLPQWARMEAESHEVTKPWPMGSVGLVSASESDAAELDIITRHAYRHVPAMAFARRRQADPILSKHDYSTHSFVCFFSQSGTRIPETGQKPGKDIMLRPLELAMAEGAQILLTRHQAQVAAKAQRQPSMRTRGYQQISAGMHYQEPWCGAGPSGEACRVPRGSRMFREQCHC